MLQSKCVMLIFRIDMMPDRYYNVIAKLCSLLLVLNAILIFMSDVLPVLINHPASDLIYTSKFGIQIFLQIINSYLMLFFGLLMSSRSRKIWQISLVLMFLVSLCNIFLWTNYLVASLTILLFCVIAVTYKVYDQDLFISYGFIFFAGLLIFALLYGVIGVYLLRTDFNSIKSLHDALYFCIVTYSTVGYGDIYPITPVAKYFVLSMILVGIVIFTSSITLIVYSMNVILRKLLNNINKGKVGMSNHIILIGYGILAKILIQQYRRDKKEFLVLDTQTNFDYDRQVLFDEKKLLVSPYMGHVETLLRSQAELAEKIIIAFDTDEATIFATMNIREYLESKNLSEMPKIISRILYQENIGKAKRSGADSVVSPHLLTAEKIMETE